MGPKKDQVRKVCLEGLISFHPVPGFARFSPGDGERFWAKVRALVEEGYRLQ